METAGEEKDAAQKVDASQMSGYLLDTRTVLWAFEGDRDLSRRAGQLIEDPANNVVISIVAYWELQIKQTIGNCARPPNTTTVSGNGSTGNGFARLGIQRSHWDRYRALPMHHRDPFNRMLIAQAQIEGFSILTANPRFKKYHVKAVW